MGTFFTTPRPFSRLAARSAKVCLFFILVMAGAHAENVGGLQFKADLYQRDLQTNTVRGKGNAWLKKDGREISADQIEVDLSTQRATAEGNVHIKDRKVDVWCRHASYNLKGEDALLEEVVLVSGQLVVTGSVVKRLDANSYQVEEGSYTNCNIDLTTKHDVSQCNFDWKLYGRSFSLTIEEYAHIQDALIYVRDIPVFYLPYLVAPVKAKRQTGFLMPGLSYSDNLGNGLRLPFFWAMSPWQDLTITPSHYSKTGLHLGFNYRYLYSDRTKGTANVFILQRRFSSDRNNPGAEDQTRPRFLGIGGEGAINLKNNIALGERNYLRQMIRYVSDPYYSVDYAGDFGIPYDQVSLRSQLAYVDPHDRYYFAGKVEHHQSLLVSKDAGVDKGAVTSLPMLYASRMTSELFNRFLSFEFDSTFANFYRPRSGYDPVPQPLNPAAALHVDPDPNYHSGDFIRTGQRLHLEPRLVLNVPTPTGIQIQPIAKLGAFFYHFDYPSSRLSSRQYIDVELPIGLYLQKQFESPWEGYERFTHILQPRFIYAKRFLQTGDTTHPFYFKDPTQGISNPRFDILDELTEFEYMRFELINRFRRRVDGGSDRFFRLQLSQQYNLKTDTDDPRFAKRLGPIELLSEMKLWRLYSQIEGFYQLEKTELGGRSVRENSLSGLVEYRSPDGDRVTIGNRIRINFDNTLTEKTVLMSFYKRLPFVFDVEGGAEYSYQRGDLLGARLGLLFASKPRSCWSLHFQFGQDDLKRKFVRFLFSLDFGSPDGKTKGA